MARCISATGNLGKVGRPLWRLSLWIGPPLHGSSFKSNRTLCSLTNSSPHVLKWNHRADSRIPNSKPQNATTTGLRNKRAFSYFRELEHFRNLVTKAAGGPNASTVRGESQTPSLKSRLSAGEKLYGAFSLSFSNVFAEILGWAGYDFVVVDMEHGAGDIFAALPVLQALAATKTPAVIRLPVNDPVLVKKALDLGPAGLMFPMIENAEEARRAVTACWYPPLGIRGAAHPIVRASRYGLDTSYLENCEQTLLIMCQVETEAAVNRIEEIVGVEGVDCIQMGPFDLRASIGLLRHPGDPRGLELLKKAETAVLSCERKVLLAGFANGESSTEELFRRGYNLVSGAVDVLLLRDAAVADLRKNKPSEY